MKTEKPLDFIPDVNQADRLLKCLFQITDLMNATRLTDSSRMDRVLKVILDYLGVEQGSLMMLERKKLVVRAASRKDIIGHKKKLDDGSVASWVATHASPLFIPDISKDSRFPQRKGKYKKDSLLSVPVIHKEKVIGVINASDKAGGKDLLRDDITQLLHLTGFILWTFVQQDLNRKITRQRTTLKKRNKELRHQQEMRSKLSSMLVHDLKAPLSEIVANLDILSYSIADEQKEFLQAAQMGCDRAVRMVSNLVSIDKIADDNLQLLYEEVDPRDLLGEAVAAVKGLARIKGIELEQQPAAGCPMLLLDRTLILRVLQNLLTNSLSYSEKGSTLTAGFSSVDEEKVEFFVQDQGSGIPQELQDFVFDKYARISSKQDVLVGTGLGLHFCKLAVELHKGQIKVESEEGKGTRFFFTLPLN